MDFTLSAYKALINSLKDNNYVFFTVSNYFSQKSESLKNDKFVIMRHDVDRMPQNALKMAKLEHDLGIKATYYFRTIPQTLKPDIIKEISDMGHEVGYHYENLAQCNGNFEMAIEDFRNNLDKLRVIAPVYTICMHGSPRSRWDAKDLWKKYDYRDFGILAEPYMDIDFNEIFYLTDTGRHWNNKTISVRDRVNSRFDIKIINTENILNLIQGNQLPHKIMINVHPHRWFDLGFNWYWELISQNLKNVIKLIIVNSHNNE